MKRNYRSVADMFVQRVQATPDKMAFQFPRGLGTDAGDETWGVLSWRQAHDRVRSIAYALRDLGLDNEQRCAIIASTRIEWVLCDLGILCAGGATTTVYPSTTADDTAFILADSGTRVVFAEDAEQLSKLVAKRDQLPEVERVVCIDPNTNLDTADDSSWVTTLADLEAHGQRLHEAEPSLFDKVVDSIRPDHLATLIYTSGTTGRPKGVELLHDCWMATAQGIADLGFQSIEDHQYLWLPLAHSFGKVMQTSQLVVGFPTTIDGRIPKLVDNLSVVQPTFMAAAPRIFEKVYNKVVTGAEEAGGAKLGIFRWACGVGRQWSRVQQRNGTPSLALRLQYRVADKLVFSKLRAKFGGRLRFFISGSAPLSPEIAEFFHGAGVLIAEGYGLTETSAASFVNRLDDYRFGTVGKPIGDIEVRIAPEDGEILLRGRGVMRGYHNQEQLTADVIDADGWFRTGDIGVLEPTGFLRITDRKKDLIKTSGGKYVAPQRIEGMLKAQCGYISNVLVHGDRRNFCSALITLEEDTVLQWARDHQIVGDYRTLTENAQMRTIVEAAVKRLNEQLASFETIKRYAILPQDFSVEAGEITPSLKVRRKEVERRYMSMLDAFYEGAIKRAS